MPGIFHSVDLKIVGEESGARVECQSTSANIDFGVDMGVPNRVYFIPFESDGYTIFDTYTVHLGMVPVDPELDQYRYIFAVYRQTGKLSDTATTLGVGELIANSTLTGPTWTGIHEMRNTTQLANPVQLPQGSYFIAVTFEAVNHLAGPLTITGGNMINANSGGMTWVIESHMQGELATAGALPTNMTTSDAALDALADTFGSLDSFWAGLFYNGDAFP